MSESLDQIEMIFQCNREEIPGVLGECMTVIRSKTKLFLTDESVFSRIKWVVTELLTNAVKHSGERETVMRISVRPEQLIIEKQDFGKPLGLSGPDNINLQWPLPKEEESIDFTIYDNGMDSLRVRTNVGGQAHFFIQHLEDIAMPHLLTDTSEHFGLLIMTKAADEFIYRYDIEKGTNHFISTFNLKTA